MINSRPGSGPAFEQINLNSVQREAVVTSGVPQLVFAGAGTGKTRVLTAKIAHLIEVQKVAPEQIFAATFTNKAASEMRERVEHLLGIRCDRLWIGTFHSLCARILRREASALGMSPDFSIYDEDDQLSVVRKLLKERAVDEKSISPRQALSSISRYKNACILPDEAAAGKLDNYYRREIVEIYRGYVKALRHAHAMDFDDLISNPVVLFNKNPEILLRYRQRFRHVLVDEYQDTNLAQFRLVHLLASGHGNVFVVGDDDQSIYGWRGAHIENILSFEKHFPRTRITKLEQNYRSTQPILSFAHAVISTNARRAEKKLWTSRQGGEAVMVTRYRDDRHEAEAVCSAAKERISRGIAPGDICILFRTNAQSRVFEENLRRLKIPYVLVGAVSFYERKEIKDCLAYLRLLVNPADDVSCERILNVPARGIGDRSRESLLTAARGQGISLLQLIVNGAAPMPTGKARQGVESFREQFRQLQEQAAGNTPPADILQSMLKLTGYLDTLEAEQSEEAEARIDNVNELVNTLAQWGGDNPDRPLRDFLEEVSLASDVDRWKRSKEAVNIMTLHSAKGLEFNTVYLVGLEEGIIPSRLNFEDEQRLEEECRLLYVGITRAKEQVLLSHVERRWRFGAVMPMSPSRYLDAVPRELYRFKDENFSPTPLRLQKPAAVTPAPEIEHYSQETVQFRMGQQVSHKVYGKGKIVNLSGFGADLRLTVLFTDGVRRKLVARFANLEPA